MPTLLLAKIRRILLEGSYFALRVKILMLRGREMPMKLVSKLLNMPLIIPSKSLAAPVLCHIYDNREETPLSGSQLIYS